MFQSFTLRARLALVAPLVLVSSLVGLTAHAATISGNAAFDKATFFNGEVFAEQTTAAQNTETGDTTLVSSSPSAASYWGMHSPFNALSFLMSTWGVTDGGGIVTFEYWNGSTWATLTLTSNTSNGFRTSNVDNLANFAFTPPSDWARTSVNGTDGYWTRIRATSAFNVTLPRATQVKGTALNVRVTANIGGGGSYTSALPISSLNENCTGVSLGEWNVGGGVHYYALRADGGSCSMTFAPNGYSAVTLTATSLTTTVLEPGYVITFDSAIVSNAQSTMSASPLSVVANNESAATITVTVKNAAGTGLAGKIVALAPSRPDVTLSPTTATTNASGVATFTARTAIAGTANFQATVDEIVLSSQAPVQFTAVAQDTTVSASQSSVVVSPASAPADNTSTITVTVTVRNAASQTLSGKTVTLQSPGLMTITPSSAVTNSNGVASFSIRSSNVGSDDATAMADGVALTTHAAFSFTTPTPPGDTTVSTSQSTVVASVSSVPANNASTASITVTARNAAGQALSGKTVTLAGSSDVSIAPSSATTDASGIATFTVRSGAVGFRSFVATVGGVSISMSPTVQFTTVSQDTTVSASRSSISVSTYAVPADIQSAIAATITIRNANGDVLSGKSVTLTNFGPLIISPTSAVVTNSSGVATFTLRSGSVVTQSFSAVADGIALGSSVTVQFTSVQQSDTTVSATQSYANASPYSVAADGAQSVAVTVTVRNAAGQPLVNKVVGMQSSNGSVFVRQSQTLTNIDGVAVIYLSSYQPLTALITPVADGVGFSTQLSVQFLATQWNDYTVNAGQSYVGATPSVIPVGSQGGTVIVIARNASGVTLIGKPVTLQSSNSNVVITSDFPYTDNTGRAAFHIRSSVSGNATFTATAEGVTLSLRPTVSFTNQSTFCTYTPGVLVKLPDDSNPNTTADTVVYYYGKDCRRHSFPNEKVFYTWFADFNSVTVIDPSVMSNMLLGVNVTYRPGYKMVKFTTDNHVYAIGHGAVLRWVKTENLANALYGSNWNKRIDDISDSFFVNYSFGTDINSVSDFSPGAELSNAVTIDDAL